MNLKQGISDLINEAVSSYLTEAAGNFMFDIMKNEVKGIKGVTARPATDTSLGNAYEIAIEDKSFDPLGKDSMYFIRSFSADELKPHVSRDTYKAMQKVTKLLDEFNSSISSAYRGRDYVKTFGKNGRYFTPDGEIYVDAEAVYSSVKAVFNITPSTDMLQDALNGQKDVTKRLGIPISNSYRTNNILSSHEKGHEYKVERKGNKVVITRKSVFEMSEDDFAAVAAKIMD